MRAVSRFNEDSGGRPAPGARAELWALIDRLAGPRDFWDRPDGDFGSLTHLYGLDVEERERANSLYRLGSKALGRGELSAAADWLGEAASAGHPGALFRLALVVLRARTGWEDDAWFLVGEAARHGHGDAERLLAAAARRFPSTSAPAPPEDPSFFEELRGLLGMPLHLLQPDPHPDPHRGLPDPGRQPGTAQEPSSAAEPEDEDGQPGGTGLVLVPAPVLPTPYGPAPRPRSATDTGRPRLTALAGGLTLPMPDLSSTAPARAPKSCTVPSTPAASRGGRPAPCARPSSPTWHATAPPPP